MKVKHVYSYLLSLVLLSDASATSAPLQPKVPSISSSSDIVRTFPKAIKHSRLPGRDSNLKNATNIAKSWDGATLFSFQDEVEANEQTSVSAGIEVTCVTCYVKGLVTAEVGFAGNFSILDAIANFTEEVSAEVENVTSVVIDYLEDQFQDALGNLTTADLDLDFPPLNVSFNADVPEIPAGRLRFRFDGLELYLLLDTVLAAGAEYTLNLYASNTPVGLSVGGETFLGVVLAVDLILAADADIDISSGLHILIADGMAFDLSLFGKEVSHLTFNGGSFEFLPVTAQSASGTLTATLRVGVHAGVSVDLGPLGPAGAGAGAGAEVAVYADLASFTTNITAVPGGDDEDCELRVQQAYELALGVAAGATLEIGPQTWGPDPTASIPIFYTTLADECLRSATPATATATATVVTPVVVSARADGDGDGDMMMTMTVTTLSDVVTFTGVGCAAPGRGAADCPLSLRTTSRVTSATTLVVTVPSGSEATFPATTRDAVPETIPFAENVKLVAATSGSPVSYVPPPPPPSSSSAVTETVGPDGSGAGADGGGSSVDKNLVIGLSVGLGVPFLTAVAAVIYFLMRRHRYAAVSGSDAFRVASSQQYYDEDAHAESKKPTVTTLTTVVESEEN
ncbi:hypothetical protein SAMD00023353_3900210 [Rosellinia necatrix]|uniref:Mid2 domain-containing protein n=1 Tax=Rosellinia necatrix TaxID=77044 RepID=A0A1S7UNJ8_ROSNE|nr:hypothetical protein SAMD00023353_3900210 [Rosellinia necatrix]